MPECHETFYENCLRKHYDGAAADTARYGARMTSITVASFPHPLTCHSRPHAGVHQATQDTITLTARAGDDLFADPSTHSLVTSASLFTFEATGDFQFRAKVNVDFQEKFDSGVLVGYFNDQKWFKICAEIDPLGHRRVVTVVTNGRSDDANSTHLVCDEIHLRVTRTGTAFALHASDDGSQWDLVRYFSLSDDNDIELRVGIAAQSPAGEGARATFSEFGWKAVGLSDPRDGS